MRDVKKNKGKLLKNSKRRGIRSAKSQQNGTKSGKFTQNREYAEQLRESIRRNEIILSVSVDGFAMIDLCGKLLKVNKALCDITGYSKEELVTMKLECLEVKESPRQISEHIDKVVKQGYARFETKHRRKDGRIIDVEVSVQFCDFGSEKFFFSFFRDITKRERLEAELCEYKEKIHQAEKLASLDSMTAIVAHELNQPLTVINLLLQESLAELDKNPTCCDVIRRNIEESLSESENATEIINQLRSSTRELYIHKADEINICRITERLLEALEEKTLRAKLRVEIKNLEELPVFRGDNAVIEQLLFILIQNAVEACDGKKRHKLVISGKLKDQTIQLQFKDDCCGIKKKNLERIFEPFFTTKTTEKSSGLGLAILRRMLLNYGGKVGVQSQSGKGTTFYVTLPFNDNVTI